MSMETPVSDQNGRAEVRFGDRDSEVIPADWAEHILRSFKRKNPSQFGNYLRDAAMNSPLPEPKGR